MGNLRDYTRCWVEERVHWIFVIDLIGRGRAAAERVAVMLLVFPSQPNEDQGVVALTPLTYAHTKSSKQPPREWPRVQREPQRTGQRPHQSTNQEAPESLNLATCIINRLGKLRLLFETSSMAIRTERQSDRAPANRIEIPIRSKLWQLTISIRYPTNRSTRRARTRQDQRGANSK